MFLVYLAFVSFFLNFGLAYHSTCEVGSYWSGEELKMNGLTCNICTCTQNATAPTGEGYYPQSACASFDPQTVASTMTPQMATRVRKACPWRAELHLSQPSEWNWYGCYCPSAKCNATTTTGVTWHNTVQNSFSESCYACECKAGSSPSQLGNWECNYAYSKWEFLYGKTGATYSCPAPGAGYCKAISTHNSTYTYSGGYSWNYVYTSDEFMRPNSTKVVTGDSTYEYNMGQTTKTDSCKLCHCPSNAMGAANPQCTTLGGNANPPALALAQLKDQCKYSYDSGACIDTPSKWKFDYCGWCPLCSCPTEGAVTFKKTSYEYTYGSISQTQYQCNNCTCGRGYSNTGFLRESCRQLTSSNAPLASCPPTLKCNSYNDLTSTPSPWQSSYVNWCATEKMCMSEDFTSNGDMLFASMPPYGRNYGGCGDAMNCALFGASGGCGTGTWNVAAYDYDCATKKAVAKTYTGSINRRCSTGSDSNTRAAVGACPSNQVISDQMNLFYKCFYASPSLLEKSFGPAKCYTSSDPYMQGFNGWFNDMINNGVCSSPEVVLFLNQYFGCYCEFISVVYAVADANAQMELDVMYKDAVKMFGSIFSDGGCQLNFKCDMANGQFSSHVESYTVIFTLTSEVLNTTAVEQQVAQGYRGSPKSVNSTTTARRRLQGGGVSVTRTVQTQHKTKAEADAYHVTLTSGTLNGVTGVQTVTTYSQDSNSNPSSSDANSKMLSLTTLAFVAGIFSFIL